MADERLWVIGPGRIGVSLGMVLRGAGAVAELVYTGRKPEPPDHPLFRGPAPPARYSTDWSLPSPAPTGIVLAVPDSEIRAISRQLGELRLPDGVPVVHTSGALGSDSLVEIAAGGNPVGSIHPLAAVADLLSGPDRLRGAWFALEGDAEAVRFGEWIARAAGGRLLHVDRGGKALYHAAAVVASNYVVVLLEIAERLARKAGLEETSARQAFVELAVGAARNVHPDGPAAALTGPIARGDAATIAAHLTELSDEDRALYSVLAQETLVLARRGGLDGRIADRLARLLEGEA